MKKLTASIVASALMILAMGINAFAAGTPKITVFGNENNPVEEGSKVSVDVRLSNFEGIKGMDITLKGDMNVELKKIVTDGYTLNENYTVKDNEIHIVDLNSANTVNLKVKAVAKADGEIKVAAKLAESGTKLAENVTQVNGTVNGPVHDLCFEERTQLARRNHLIMKKLGMQPVLPGYSGMVPTDIKKYDPEAEIIPQGTWGGMQRPAMLKTDTETFSRYAQMFYKAQKEVFGDAMYFAADPFHEGGVTGGMSPRMISATVLKEMLKANPNAVWVIQSWEQKPSSELLAGLSDVENGKKHAVILDLYAEKKPNYRNGKPGNKRHGYSPEFDGTPWVYCMLNNFGGRLGLHGHLDNMVNGIPKVMNVSAVRE